VQLRRGVSPYFSNFLQPVFNKIKIGFDFISRSRLFFILIFMAAAALAVFLSPKPQVPGIKISPYTIVGDTVTFTAGDSWIADYNDPQIEGKNIIVQNGARVFMNGEHAFNSMTIENGGQLGTVGIGDNFLIKWTGYVQIPSNDMWIRLTGDDAVKLRLRPLNGSWQEVSNWVASCGAQCPRNADIGPLSSGLYEIEAWYRDDVGIARVSLQMTTGILFSLEPIATNYLFTGLDATHTTACTTNPVDFRNGLCGEYYPWAEYTADPADVDPNHNIQNFVSPMVDFYWELNDPFKRTSDFAWLKLTINNDLDVKSGGQIRIAGGRNEGPYIAELYDTTGNIDPRLPITVYDDMNQIQIGKLEVNANNIYIGQSDPSGLDPNAIVSINGLDAPKFKGLVGDLRDGGNAGIVNFNVVYNFWINDSGLIEAIGGDGSPQAGPSSGGSGGGGSGGIVRIYPPQLFRGYGNINISGGTGGEGTGVASVGRPGRSLYAITENAFYSIGDTPIPIPQCWRQGTDCVAGGVSRYNTCETSGSRVWLGNCGNVAQATSSSQHGGYRGGNFVPPPYNGNLSGAGGGGNGGGGTEGGGGGGGAAGAALIGANKLDPVSYTSVSNLVSLSSGGRGGQGSGSGSGAGGLGGTPFINIDNNIHEIYQAANLSLNNPGNCGVDGSLGGGAGGGGGGGPFFNISFQPILIPPPSAIEVEGDVHAKGNISISGNATGVVTATGLSINTNFNANELKVKLTSYTIDSASFANWENVVTSTTTKLFETIKNRLLTERAQTFTSEKYLNLNPEETPEGGVWRAATLPELTPLGDTSYNGRGTLIVENQNVNINSNLTSSSPSMMGLIVLNGNVTIGSDVTNLRLAIFAPNGTITIASNPLNSKFTFSGILIAQSIYIQRSNSDINYNQSINGVRNSLVPDRYYSALPGFSQILPPSWQETVL